MSDFPGSDPLISRQQRAFSRQQTPISRQQRAFSRQQTGASRQQKMRIPLICDFDARFFANYSHQLLPRNGGLLPGNGGLLPGNGGLLPGNGGLLPGKNRPNPHKHSLLPGNALKSPRACARKIFHSPPPICSPPRVRARRTLPAAHRPPGRSVGRAARLARLPLPH